MSHLSPEELIDIAEGTREGPPHLAQCENCRHQLADLRTMMASMAEVEVPEPSPLFWDHLSARVSKAVAEEPDPRRSWFATSFATPRMAVPMAVLALAAVVALALWVRPVAPASARGAAVPPQASAQSQPEPSDRAASLAEPSGDPSFAFVVDLTTDMDMDTAIEAGLVSDESADHAVMHMNAAELRALAELLQAEIAKGQAS